MNIAKSKRWMSIFVVVVLAVQFFLVPLKAYADLEVTYQKLGLSATNVDLYDQWSKIKNAAQAHLVFQKFGRCMDSVTRATTGSTTTQGFSAKDVASGNVYSRPTNIGTGVWFEGHFTDGDGKNDGNIKCTDQLKSGGSLMSMAAYVYKNYNSDFALSGSVSVSKEDILKVACNDAGTGIFKPAKYGDAINLGNDGTTAFDLVTQKVEADSSISCTDAEVFKFNEDAGQRDAFLKQLYQDFQAKSGNEYIQRISFDDLHNYDKVDGFYLYSLDFEKQCSSISATFVEGATDGEVGFKVDSSGNVKSGSYYINDSSKDTAKGSFAMSSGSDTKTCRALIRKMNDTIGEYVKFVNEKILNYCRQEINKEIAKKKSEIEEKVLNDPERNEEEKAAAREVLNEYERVQRTGEHVAKRDASGGEELIQFTGGEVPTDFIWTCRDTLAGFNITIHSEDELLGDFQAENFYDACLQSEEILLPWVVCPMIDALAGAVDMLANGIEGFFE
ncbi:hypothetical protein IKF03_01390 [Candidatus Saccharibacteria bacterium]|nr:hypothetical protein [Candidatus Saccharibacteria bacterium]